MYLSRQLIPIRAVIFDFGGVLYTYNYWTLMRDFAKELKITPELASRAWETRINEFERGEIEEPTFWNAFRKTAKVATNDTILHAIFLRQFAPMPASIDISLRLKKRYLVGMLSNNCAWESDLRKNFSYRQNYSLILMSYELGTRKPESKIFQILIEHAGCKPEEIVFIDDTADYAPAVRHAGIRFIPFRNAAQLAEDLHLLGVWW